MSDAFDFEDDDEGGQRKASLAQVAAFMWKHWASQPAKLALFGLFFGLAIAADLAFPFASKGLVDALSAGPTEAGARAAAWGYGFVALLAFVFYAARNIGVRFWIPFAANNMERIVCTATARVLRPRRTWLDIGRIVLPTAIRSVSCAAARSSVSTRPRAVRKLHLR